MTFLFVLLLGGGSYASAGEYPESPTACPVESTVIPTSSVGGEYVFDGKKVIRRVGLTLKNTGHPATHVSFLWRSQGKWEPVEGQFLLPADGKPHCFFLGSKVGIPENVEAGSFKLATTGAEAVESVTFAEKPFEGKARSCPSPKVYGEARKAYAAAKKSAKKVPAFVKALEKLLPSYDCRRSYDYDPVPAWWLCTPTGKQGCSQDDVEKWFELLSSSKDPAARALFASKSFRDSLDGEWAEQYRARSLEAERNLPKVFPGIRRLSPTKYEVTKAEVDSRLSNLTELLMTARVVPHMEKGAFAGFRLVSVDADSPFKALGLVRGDVLLAANEVRFDNVGKGLEAFQVLRGVDDIKLKIRRSGKPITLEYRLK